MFVTKLIHSCVLVETDTSVALFDAGVWVSDEMISTIKSLDEIIYTHQHTDHFDLDVLRKLVVRFPNARVVSNNAVRDLVIGAGISLDIQEQTGATVRFESPHAAAAYPGIISPPENGYHFKDVFTHPGDSHNFTNSKAVLAMPFVSRWGRTLDAVNKVIELKPAFVLPIHDWHYHEEARDLVNEALIEALSGCGIKVLSARNGIRHEV